MVGDEIAYFEYGPKNGKPVVFVHGFPFDRRMWQAQADHLSNRGHRIILPDLRGFGKTPLGPGDASVRAHAGDLVSLADKLVLDKFVFVGFSMGGYVALEFARLFGARLRGLGLIDTRAEPDGDEAKKARDQSIEKVRAGGSGVLAEGMLPKMLTERTRKGKPDLAKLVETMIRDQPKDGVVQALAALRDRPDQRPTLQKIICPTLVMVGAEDTLTPITAAQDLQRGIPNAQLRIITGAAHLSPMEAAEPVNHFLEDWLKNLDAPQMAKTGIQRLGLKVEGAAKEQR